MTTKVDRICDEEDFAEFGRRTSGQQETRQLRSMDKNNAAGTPRAEPGFSIMRLVNSGAAKLKNISRDFRCYFLGLPNIS